MTCTTIPQNLEIYVKMAKTENTTLRANKNQINLYFTSKQNTACKLLINVTDTKAEKNCPSVNRLYVLNVNSDTVVVVIQARTVQISGDQCDLFINIKIC